MIFVPPDTVKDVPIGENSDVEVGGEDVVESTNLLISETNFIRYH